MSHFQTNADYLNEKARLTRAVKEITYSYLDLEHASSVLDVGCGVGIDVLEMAGRTGPHARLVGIDLDPEMIREAGEAEKSENLNRRIEWVQGSALPLPFESGSFDRIRAERFFQVISPEEVSEEGILDEFVRVLAKGGIMTLADTDWATASLDFSDSDMERRFLRFFSEKCRPNGYSGRRFYGSLKRAGMRDVELSVVPVTMYAFSEKDPLAGWLVKELSDKGAASPEETELWMSELSTKSEKGEFFGVVNMNIVKGVKP